MEAAEGRLALRGVAGVSWRNDLDGVGTYTVDVSAIKGGYESVSSTIVSQVTDQR